MLDPQLQSLIRKMPKIELHRHLEGALRLSTLVEIARKHTINLPRYDIEALRPLVQMMPGETRNSENFLSKFNMLRQFYRDEEIIQRITREAVEDAAADNVRYLELRFTPKALSNHTNAPLEEMVPIVCEAGNRAAAEQDITVRYIVSMNRHESVAIGETVLQAAIDHRHLGVVGVDLAGDEANYSCMPFHPLFREAAQEQFGVTIHAGEWAGVDSVLDAINGLQANRVGHGIRVIDDPEVLAQVIEREIVLEVCPSSNVLSGVVPTMAEHPLRQLTAAGARTTINTDDPLLQNVTLSDEIAYVMEGLKLSLLEIKSYTMRAAQAAFLPEAEREAMIAEFETLLDDIVKDDSPSSS